MTRRITSLLLAAAALPAFAAYDINYPADAHITHSNRQLGSIRLNVAGIAGQTLDVGQEVGGQLYFDLTDKCLVGLPGASADIELAWTGTWMNTYIYVDRADDGSFDSDPESDLIAFSNLNGVNSAGASTGGGDVLQPPTFAIPADISAGLHRMRVKIDWDSADPAGSTAEGNDILKNGGAIVDVMLLVPESDGTLSVTAGNGSLTLADGTPANGSALPASGTLDLTVVPDAGYAFDGLIARGGFTCPDASVTIAEPSLAGGAATYTAASLRGSVISIPVEKLAGKAAIEAFFLAHDESSGEPYASPYSGTKSTADGFTSLTLNGKKINVASTALHEPASQMLNLQRGADINLAAAFSGEASKFNFYIDLNHDGEFNSNSAAMSCELLAQAATADAFSAVKLPESIGAGVYRARIEAEGHSDADFFINVHESTVNVRVQALNALVLNNESNPLADTHEALTSLRVRTSPTLPGFEPVRAIVRHGQNLSGPEFVGGNPQWADYEARILNSGTINVPSSVVNGDLELYVIYEESAGSEWTKVWGDEFNSGKLDSKRWQYHPREGATWNRLIAQGLKQQRLVNTFENGYYNSHCIATPAEFTNETQPMISGAIMSEGKFSVKFGKIEARIKTTPHTGNFPAFWMMPAYSELKDAGLNGWPMDGEIDIWEQIDADNRAHHTVHSGWTGWSNYCKWPVGPKQSSPTSTTNEYSDATLWHVYALEWDAEEMRWYVDGNLVFTYANQHYSEEGSPYYLEKVTWPFDKHFYIILNQSVGNGAWAKNPDVSFHYLTLFDYVRVYQKKSEQSFESTAKDNGDDPDFYVPAKGADDTESAIVDIDAEPSANGLVEYFDLNGRRVDAAGLIPGIYIEKQGSKASKIIVR